MAVPTSVPLSRSLTLCSGSFLADTERKQRQAEYDAALNSKGNNRTGTAARVALHEEAVSHAYANRFALCNHTAHLRDVTRKIVPLLQRNFPHRQTETSSNTRTQRINLSPLRDALTERSEVTWSRQPAAAPHLIQKDNSPRTYEFSLRRAALVAGRRKRVP